LKGSRRCSQRDGGGKKERKKKKRGKGKIKKGPWGKLERREKTKQTHRGSSKWETDDTKTKNKIKPGLTFKPAIRKGGRSCPSNPRGERLKHPVQAHHLRQ